MRDAILALVSKEPAHGYELHQRLSAALGAADGELNPGQVYVTLTRLERAGLVVAEQVEQATRADKKVYAATAAGRERVHEWLADTSWTKAAPVDFHLKLVAAAAARLADPLTLVDVQRRELLRVLGQVQRALGDADTTEDGTLLLEATALRLQADLRWLEACERHWATGDRR